MDLVYKKIVKERFRQKLSDDSEVDTVTASNRNLTSPRPEVKILIQELFNKMISIEAEIESWRLKLNKIRTFNIKAAFEKIIVRETPMNLGHLENYLSNFDFSLDDVQVLYNRLDKDGKNSVTYLDVSQF
jgi:hypothetical protein